MAITENKLRQIIRQEIKLVLESRQPTEDLAELYLKLDKLLSFHFGGKHEEETLSVLKNDVLPTLESLIQKIYNADLNNINEVFKFLNYFKKQPDPQSTIFNETEIQKIIREVRNKIQELERAIFAKREKEYDAFHTEYVLPEIKHLGSVLSTLIENNTRFPQPNPQRTKRDLLKRLRWGH